MPDKDYLKPDERKDWWNYCSKAHSDELCLITNGEVVSILQRLAEARRVLADAEDYMENYDQEGCACKDDAVCFKCGTLKRIAAALEGVQR